MHRLCVATFLLFLFSGLSGAQDQTASPSSTRPDYTVGPGDVISVKVFGLEDFTQVVRVSNSGRAHIRRLGVLQISGMTIPALEVEIARQIRERGLVKEPWVQIRVVEYRAQPVYILGEVMIPGQFVIESEMYVTDLVVLSLGFNEVASPVGYLYRRRQGAPPDAASEDGGDSVIEEAIPINFMELYEGKNPELNLRLRGGDVLYVPQIRQERFFVVGDVHRTGSFIIPPNEKILASRAISLAGGPLKTAKMGKGILVRFGEDGERTETKVNFKALLSGRQPDMEVQPNDIIFIPGSAAKTLGYGMLGMLPSLASEAVIQR